jgi:hypothetical protein
MHIRSWWHIWNHDCSYGNESFRHAVLDIVFTVIIYLNFKVFGWTPKLMSPPIHPYKLYQVSHHKIWGLMRQLTESG